MVGDLKEYVQDAESIKRKGAATISLAWESKGVDVGAMIKHATALDERFCLYMALQHHIGLRKKEAMHLRPLHSNFGDGALEVFEGTKGGRPRLVAVDTQEQRDVVAWTKRIALKSLTGSIM